MTCRIGVFQFTANGCYTGLDTLEGKSSMVPIICHFLDNNLPFSDKSNNFFSIFGS